MRTISRTPPANFLRLEVRCRKAGISYSYFSYMLWEYFDFCRFGAVLP